MDKEGGGIKQRFIYYTFVRTVRVATLFYEQKL